MSHQSWGPGTYFVQKGEADQLIFFDKDGNPLGSEPEFQTHGAATLTFEIVDPNTEPFDRNEPIIWSYTTGQIIPANPEGITPQLPEGNKKLELRISNPGKVRSFHFCLRLADGHLYDPTIIQKPPEPSPEKLSDDEVQRDFPLTLSAISGRRRSNQARSNQRG